MRILLINSPIRLNANPNCLPYGLAVIASVLRNRGFDVDVYDINALRHSHLEIQNELKYKTWDVAGISGLITTYTFQQWLAHELKTLNPDAPVISGGGLATSVPDILFETSDVDYVVIGEGEETLPELCTAIDTGSDVRRVNGIGYRNDKQCTITAKRSNIKNLDDLPFPAWDLFPMEIYLKYPIWGGNANNSSGFKEGVSLSRSMNIISSRGCPYSCHYCYHLFGKSSFRYRSAHNVADEMELLITKYNVDFIGFVDDNTMASEERLLELCSLIRERKLNIHWGCHGRVTNARPEILKEMASSGCVWIGYGIESGSQKMLNAMNKKVSLDQAKNAIINTRNQGIYPNTTFIFGYPGESLETIKETIDFKRELDIECGSFFATPYPGTHLYSKYCSQIQDLHGYIETLNDATDFTVNLTDFDTNTLFRLKECYDSNTYPELHEQHGIC